MRKYMVASATLPEALEKVRAFPPAQVTAKFKWFNLDGKLIRRPATTLTMLYRNWYGECEVCPENGSELMDLEFHLPGNKLLAIKQDAPVAFGELMDLLEGAMSFRPIAAASQRKASGGTTQVVNSMYRSIGIKDSRKEGWYRKGKDGRVETSRLVVETPAGKIIAEVASDPSYPGIYLDFLPLHAEPGEEMQVALFDFSPSNGNSVSIRVWGDPEKDETYPKNGEDFTFKHYINARPAVQGYDGNEEGGLK